MEIRRLTAEDLPTAGATFALMAEVFVTRPAPLSDAYLRRTLGRPEF